MQKRHIETCRICGKDEVERYETWNEACTQLESSYAECFNADCGLYEEHFDGENTRLFIDDTEIILRLHDSADKRMVETQRMRECIARAKEAIAE